MSSIKFLFQMACAGLAAATQAVAQDSPAPATAGTSAETPVAGTAALVSTPAEVPVEANDAAAADLGLAALADAELSSLRGGEALVVSNQTLTAITSGNVINGNYTAGNVSLSDHALSSFNGVGNLLINTGGQVSLQTGMNLTINVGE